LALSACDRDRLAAAHLDVTIQIVRHNRLLEPADIEIGHGTAKRDRLQRIESVIGVEHHADTRPDGLAHGADERGILLDPKSDLELYGLEPFADITLHLFDDIIERVAATAAVGAGRVSIDGRSDRAAE